MTLRTTSHSIQGFSAFEQTTIFRVIEIFMNSQHTKWMFHSVGYCTDRHERRRVAFREKQSVQQSTEANWLARARDSRCAVPSKTRPARPCRSLVTADGAQREREKERQRLSEQHATEADWLPNSRGCRCVEPSKTRSQFYVPITLVHLCWYNGDMLI
jgi:hypothetical protein